MLSLFIRLSEQMEHKKINAEYFSIFVLCSNKKTFPVVFYNWPTSFVCLQAPSINHYVNPCSDLYVYLTCATIEKYCYENKRFFFVMKPVLFRRPTSVLFIVFPPFASIYKKKIQSAKSRKQNARKLLLIYIYNRQ